MDQVTDLHVAQNIPLPTPKALMERIPRTAPHAHFVHESRKVISRILSGEDERLLLLVGPCSIHDTHAGLAYARKLAALAEELKDQVYVVMRVYFEKPRTQVGWKGLVMDPHLDGSCDIAAGLEKARQFLCDVIDLGLPTGTELLDPITPQYIAGLICWSAIGARTVESQTHRQMASGLSMPLGLKNSTAGDVVAAVNAIVAASKPQTFLGVSEDGVASAVSTSGNPDCHLILRGGDTGPNYDEASIAAACEQLAKANLPERIMIDCSHGNSNKDHNRQPEVLEALMTLRNTGITAVMGAMLESNLEAGNQSFPQPLSDLTYGQSITDACIDWETTERVLRAAFLS